jgi:hypothetical protein
VAESADLTGSTGVGSTVWERAASAAFVESAERVVVLDLDHPELPPYVFEGSGAQIWACVDGDRTESEIVADLAQAFEVPVEIVAPDVREFIARLAELGLVLSDAPRSVFEDRDLP